MSNETGNELVLVTGGSGFIGSHCIIQLLDAGYRVRSTVRSADKEPALRALVGNPHGDRLTFAVADLLKDGGWAEAAAGCDYVLHVASPFPLNTPKEENDLIIPAREGALRVLKAARDAGVKRVVQTSSFAAIGYGVKQPESHVFTEKDWSDPNGENIGAYPKSKTLAERAAWDFIGTEGGSMELSVVNPVGVFGPALNDDISTSIEIVKRVMSGSLPAIPNLNFGVVDVRDVADLHIRAMTDPAASGQRFLAVGDGSMSLEEMAQALRRRLGPGARKVPTRRMPDWVVKALALVVPPLRQVTDDLGRVKVTSNEKAKTVLGWAPRSNEDAVVASAESLLALGIVKV